MNLVNEGVLPPDELDDRDERREEQERARRRETVADIVAEKRTRANEIERDVAAKMKSGEMVSDQYAREVVADLRKEADRLEAAWKRDEERAVEHATRHAEAVARDNCRDCVHNPSGKNYEGGNAAAVREALLTLRDAARNFCHQILNSKYNDMMDTYKCRERGFPALLDLRAAIPKANFALSAPPRNCDVGTAKEQTRRMFEQYCSKQISCYELPSGEHCPLRCTGVDCQLAWSQMPYKAEEGGAK